MATIDTNTGTSAKDHHDALKSMLRAVLTASKNLKKKVEAQYLASGPQNEELTSKLTRLGILEDAFQKIVEETSATPAGLEVAIQRLESFQDATRDDYTYMSDLGQQIAPEEEKKLLDAMEKQFKLIKDVQDFITGPDQSQSISAPIVDKLFWLRGQLKNKEIQLTEKLLQGTLDDPKDQKRLAKLTVDKLISDWEKATNVFVGQTQPILTGGDPQQIAVATSALFFVHRQLQTLYNNLNAT